MTRSVALFVQPRVCLLAIATLAIAAPAQADTRALLASLYYESAQLVVPVVAVRSTDDRGHEWNAWLAGWTLGADWSVAPTPRRRWRVEVRVTPFNAQSSDYIYVDGQRDPAAAFRAASLEAAAGVEIAHASHWTGRYRGIIFYERVSGTTVADIQSFWDHPFAGVEIAHSYSRVRSETRLGSRWDGVKAEASAQVYGGDHTWSRFRAGAGVGRRAGPLFLSGRAAAASGRSLNTVSAFLVGGSWDLAVPDLLAGYRYAEFRVDRAGTVRAGVDLRIHGALEVGVRGGFLKAPGLARSGAALQVMTIWKGAVIDAGIAIPDGAREQRRSRIVAFATITAAIVGR
jgi:hypothetical protein